MATPPLPPKKEVFLALLQGPSVFIHLDPRRDGVTVPGWFKKQFQLVLQVGLNMAVRIADLEVNDDGVSCTLSFSRSPFWCDIPWSAVYALVGEEGRGMVWQDDVPSELATQDKRPNLKAVPKPKAKKERLAVVRPIGGGSPDDGNDVPEAGASEQNGEARPWLSAVPDPGEGEPDAAQAAEGADDGDGNDGNDGDGKDGADDGDGNEDKPTDPDDNGSNRDLPPYLRVIK